MIFRQVDAKLERKVLIVLCNRKLVVNAFKAMVLIFQKICKSNNLGLFQVDEKALHYYYNWPKNKVVDD